MRAIPIAFAAVLLAACATESVTRAVPSPTAAAPSPTPSPLPTAPPTAALRFDQLPEIASDPAALALQLVMVEAFIRDPNVTGDQLGWAGHAEQLCISRLADYPDWTTQVLAALPAAQRAAVAASIEAGKQLRSLHSGPIPKNLPDWHIVQPPPIEELLTYYREAEAKLGVPWYFLASINLIETRMGRIRGDSSAGA
ncbi:MAG TPA: lytic transglycosylase domain-containing protein, partial [Candidatus Limnocylindria bacterium]|nr:lytic transglycosylase domain-containing protein [Candidatus Limnocylindria bacterium]